MDIQAEYKKAQNAYEDAAKKMEEARMNPDRLSLDPGRKAQADAAFRKARDAAQAAYEEVDDLEKVARRQAERAAAKAAAAQAEA